jgi:hypothetical protein
MSNDLVARLEARRRQEIAQAVDAVLAEGDTPTVQRHLQTIDACAKLLSTFPPERKHDWLLPAGVAIACLAVASSLWTLRVRHTDVAASLETASLTGTLAQPWSIADAPRFTRIKVEGPSKIDLPSLGLSSLRDVPAGEAWVALEGDAIALETVEIAAGTRVDVETEKGEIVVYVRDAPVAGKVKVQVQGKVRVTAASADGETAVDTERELNDVPESVELATQVGTAVPTVIRLHSQESWSLGRPTFHQLGFTREITKAGEVGESELVSGLKGGTIRFNDAAGSELEAREADFVALRGLEDARVELRAKDGLLHVALNGTVGGVTLGEGDAKREQMPSYLEYLYNKKSLGVVWSAILFLWGLIWSVRRVIVS